MKRLSRSLAAALMLALLAGCGQAQPGTDVNGSSSSVGQSEPLPLLPASLLWQPPAGYRMEAPMYTMIPTAPYIRAGYRLATVTTIWIFPPA